MQPAKTNGAPSGILLLAFANFLCLSLGILEVGMNFNFKLFEYDVIGGYY